MLILYLIILVFLSSCSLTWGMRRYALVKHILDIPNHRSSHQVPTPRGGGVAFVGVFLIVMLGLAYYHLASCSMSLLGLSSFIAILGFCDDKYTIPALWRFMGHFAIAILVIITLHGMPSITLGWWLLSPGYLANALAVLYLVWLLNLYNFMDGIDGIASVEAITVCLGALILYGLTHQTALMLTPVVLISSVAGFLYWNFPPARIFMGDAGSSFLGLILGVLSIQSAALNPNFFWSWLIFLGVFIVDATFTLFYRLWHGEKIYEAHRNHAYQYASRLFNGHLPVTLGVLILNIIWLWPLALLVGLGYINGLLGVFIAYSPLIILTIQFKTDCHVT